MAFAISYMMVADTLIQTLIKEKACKHLLIISGANRSVIWLSHYLVDVGCHLIPCLVSLISIEIL